MTRLLLCVLLTAGCSQGYPVASELLGQGDQQLGASVSAAGDVNGDGFDDVIVGAPGEGGAAFVFQGTSSGLDTSPAAVLHQPGFASRETARVEGRFGYAVSAAGDVNGDGYADVIVGTPQPRYEGGARIDPLEGRAYVFHGTSAGVEATPATTLGGPEGYIGDSFGSSVAAAGDVNGDGFGDVVVNALIYASSEFSSAAFVFHGTPAGLEATPALVLESEPTGAIATLYSIAGAGDVDGDGFDDVIVGQPREETIHVFHGSAEGLDPTPTATLHGPAVAFQFGEVVSGAGDVNADGFDDVMVGTWFAAIDSEEPTGIAYVYPGSPSGLDATALATLERDSPHGQFAYAVCGAGDFDGDGFGDVVIGAPGERRGRSYVYRGTSGSLDLTPVAMMKAGDREFFDFGYAVSGAGDVNGDGYDDVIIGAPKSSSGGDGDFWSTYPDRGAAYVFHGADDAE